PAVAGRDRRSSEIGSASAVIRVLRWMCPAVACVLTANAAASPAVHARWFRFVDRARTVQLPDGRRAPRTLETIVRYPATPGRHPLIVCGQGSAVRPGTWAPLLRAWAQAGYVVAAPVFPLGNADAPGGPEESDIVNQPRDMSVVITRLLALDARRRGVLAG